MRLNVKLGIEADATRTAVEDTIEHSGAVLKGERPRLLGGAASPWPRCAT